MEQLAIVWHDIQQLLAASEGLLAGVSLGGLSSILTPATLNRFLVPLPFTPMPAITSHVPCCSRQDTVSLALGSGVGVFPTSAVEATRLAPPTSSAFGAAKFAADAAAAAAADAAAKQIKGPAGSFYS
jgi:hypothetical protein